MSEGGGWLGRRCDAGGRRAFALGLARGRAGAGRAGAGPGGRRGQLFLLSGDDPAAGWWNAALTAVFVLVAPCLVASLAGQVASWRHSSGERRQQLKWLMAGTAAVVAGAGISAVPGTGTIGMACFLAGLFVFSLCVGAAVLRYRLFDIDRVISRTLAYAVVTGLLVGVYAGIVLLATRVLPLSDPVAVAVATLAAAALFHPLRRRVQKMVDRRFNRARYDADQTIAAFAARLQDAVALDRVRADLASSVQQALEPAQVSVWISAAGTPEALGDHADTAARRQW